MATITRIFSTLPRKMALSKKALMKSNLATFMANMDDLFAEIVECDPEKRIVTLAFRSYHQRKEQILLPGDTRTTTRDLHYITQNLIGHLTIYTQPKPGVSEVFECDLSGVAKIRPGMKMPKAFDIRWKQLRIYFTQSKYMPADRQSAIQQVIRNWVTRHLERGTKQYIMEHMKPELVAAVWHPRRVAKWLEEGGWEAVENIE